MRPWVRGIVESILAGAFVALFVLGMFMVTKPYYWYGLEPVERTVLMTWDAVPWVVLA